MVCIDNKHRLKVGESGFPVAAAERGWKVIVCADTTFEVGDHDFTKFSIIPSVSLLVDIPDNLQDSWYRGQVFKDAAFEALSPFGHATELSHVLGEHCKPVLFMYSDGGPDHRLTYVSVQVNFQEVRPQLSLRWKNSPFTFLEGIQWSVSCPHSILACSVLHWPITKATESRTG